MLRKLIRSICNLCLGKGVVHYTVISDRSKADIVEKCWDCNGKGFKNERIKVDKNNNGR